MKNFIFALELFLIFAIASAVPDQYRTIETKYGKIRGFKRTSLLEKVDFYSFLGIPYAKAPIDQRRFKVSRIDSNHFTTRISSFPKLYFKGT